MHRTDSIGKKLLIDTDSIVACSEEQLEEDLQDEILHSNRSNQVGVAHQLQNVQVK